MVLIKAQYLLPWRHETIVKGMVTFSLPNILRVPLDSQSSVYSPQKNDSTLSSLFSHSFPYPAPQADLSWDVYNSFFLSTFSISLPEERTHENKHFLLLFLLVFSSVVIYWKFTIFSTPTHWNWYVAITGHGKSHFSGVNVQSFVNLKILKVYLVMKM